MRIELASAGDCAARRRRSTQLVLAAREAMANAAKFSGADEISVYAEADDDAAPASSSATAAPASTARPCRPTGAASPSRSRAGWQRAGGTATIVSSPGDGHRGRADARRGGAS